MTIEDVGLPCSLLITEPFVPIRDRMAEVLGFPAYPATILPHPMSIRDRDWLRGQAERLVPQIIRRLVID